MAKAIARRTRRDMATVYYSGGSGGGQSIGGWVEQPIFVFRSVLKTCGDRLYGNASCRIVQQRGERTMGSLEVVYKRCGTLIGGKATQVGVE